MGRCARNARPRRNRKVLHQTNCALSHRHPGKKWKGRHGFKQAKILKLISMYVHPESYFLHRGIHEIIFFSYIYICYMYPKYTFVCHSRDKPLSTVLLEITYVRNKQNSTSWGKRNRWLVHGNCKFRQGGGFPWARKCGHGCLLVNDTTVIREIRFEDMIWYVFGLVPRTTSHWKIVGNESRAKGSMNICQWGRVKGKCGTLYCSCTVVFCMPMIWYNCDCLILEHFFVSFGHDVGWSYFVLFRIIIFNQLTGWVQSCRFSWCIFCSGLHLWHSTTFDGVTKWRVAEGQQEANANRWLDFRDCNDGGFRSNLGLQVLFLWHDIPDMVTIVQ